MTKAIVVRAAAQIGGTSVLALTPACLSPAAVQTQQILAWCCSTAPLAKFMALFASASDRRRRGAIDFTREPTRSAPPPCAPAGFGRPGRL